MKGKKGFQPNNRVGYKHGLSFSRIYRIWVNMRERVDNKSNKRYYSYGDRGINIFSPWRDFILFKDWALSNGYADNLTIDRIDNDKDYCPDNCRWVTQQVNSKNRRILPMTGIRKRRVGWQVRGKNTQICLGTFASLEVAIKVRDNYAQKQIILLNKLIDNEKRIS